MYNPKPNDDPEFKFPLECFWLRFNGSWPTHFNYAKSGEPFFTKKNIISLIYITWSWSAIIITAIIVFFEILFLFNNFDDVASTAEVLCGVFNGCFNVFRLIYVRIYTNDLKALMNNLVKDIWIPTNSPQQDVKELCRKKMFVFHFMGIFFCLVIILYQINPIFEWHFGDKQVKPLPYLMVIPYNEQDPMIYVITYIMCIIAGSVSLSCFFAVDTIFGFFVLNVCGQFEIIHTHIDNILVEAYAYAWENFGSEPAKVQNFQFRCMHNLSEIIKTHNVLIRFCEQLETFFSPMLLINFLSSSLLICVVGFQVITGPELLLAEYVKFIFYGLGVFCQLVVLCWLGENLITKSTDTAHHLYGCSWEGKVMVENKHHALDVPDYDVYQPQNPVIIPTDRNFKISLQFMIMCSKQPLTITAYKFSILSLESFTTIISSSMSYFALLQNMYNESS